MKRQKHSELVSIFYNYNIVKEFSYNMDKQRKCQNGDKRSE
jgi:hypothetical protein